MGRLTPPPPQAIGVELRQEQSRGRLVWAATDRDDPTRRLANRPFGGVWPLAAAALRELAADTVRPWPAPLTVTFDIRRQSWHDPSDRQLTAIAYTLCRGADLLAEGAPELRAPDPRQIPAALAPHVVVTRGPGTPHRIAIVVEAAS